MKILFPLEESKGLESKIALHFGRAPWIGIWNTETQELKIIPNPLLELHEKFERPVLKLIELGFQVVFVKGIGRKAVEVLKEKGIKIKTGDFNTVREALENEEKWVEI